MSGYDESIHIHLLTRLAPKIWAASQYLSALLWVLQTRRLINKTKPDIVDGHFVTVYGFLAACSGFHPLVVSTWGSDILVYPRRNSFFKAITRYALKKADLITCDGENAMEAIAKIGADTQKISLVSFGVDTQKFNIKQKDEKLKEKLGMNNSPIVISLRNLEPIYDIDSLIDSIPIVLKEVPEAKFIIAGRGSQETKLKELAKSLGVIENVNFVGWISHDELPKYLASSDLYVSTSLSDTISISLLEAMACGLAPIVTDVGDNRKWIENGKNGFVIPTKSPELLAEKTIYLLKNKELRGKMGKLNQQLVEQKVNYGKEMGKVEKLYEELIGRYKS